MQRRLLRFTSIGLLLYGAVLLFVASSSGPTSVDATGSPYDSNQNACTQCHGSFALNSGTGSVTVNAPSSYYPGESYTVTVTVAQSSPPPNRYGFQALPLRDNNNAAGSITAGSGQGTWSSSGRNYVQHNSTVNTSGTWTFTWNAPSFADTVVFYAGGLAANGNSGTSGDYVYTTTTTILPIQPITFTRDSSDATCFEGCDGTVGVSSVSGGIAPYTYAWSTGATTSSVTGLCAGSYTVTITDDQGHEEEATIQVNEPNPITGVFNILPSSCAFGDGEISVTPTGGNGGYSYQWNDTANTTGNTIIQAGIGWFTVTITDSAGCTAVDSAEVFQSGSGLNGVITSGPEHCDQADGTAQISMFAGNTPYTYAWSQGGTSSFISGLTAGSYAVTVVDSIGCTETFPGIVPSKNLVLAPDSFITKNIECFNGNDGAIVLFINEGEPPFNYLWSHDSLLNNDIANNLAAGTYSIMVVDDAGCEDSVEVTLTQPDSVYAVVSVDSANEGFCDGFISIDMMGGTPPYTFAWPHDASITSNEATDLCPGSYLISTTDDVGCLFNVNTSVPTRLGLDNPEARGIQIYPNPSNGSFMLKGSNAEDFSDIVVTDLQGREVWVESSVSPGSNLDLTTLPDGQYHLVARQGERIHVQRLIIQR